MNKFTENIKSNDSVAVANRWISHSGKKSSDLHSNWHFPVLIQFKLSVGAVDDPMEYEADAIADRVMRMPDQSFIQRKCSHCEEEEKLQKKPLTTLIQRTEDSEKSVVSEQISHKIQSSKGNGRAIPAPAKSFMESRFGADFSNVKIHTDNSAAQLSRQLNAQAFTVGNDVFFNEGKYAPESTAGKHLFAHELVHTVQQTGGQLMRQPEKEKDYESVEECEKRKDGNILPGKVGLVAQIDREVALTEILGPDYDEFVGEVRKDPKAHEFVCEYGMLAVSALYYNRDYKKRLNVRGAKLAFVDHPEYYVPENIDLNTQNRKTLEKQYAISIERGNKDWSPHDMVLLKTALEQLSKSEASLIKGYRFIRWTNRCYQLEAQNPDYDCSLDDYGICGLHEPDIIRRNYTITMYDCMEQKDSEQELKYTIISGADTIIHEIGHAVEIGKLRLAMEKYYDLKKEYDKVKLQSKDASVAEKKTFEDKLKALEKDRDSAEKVMNHALDNSTLEEFVKLIKGRRPLTPYSATNDKEAFAEAFMLFKVDPNGLFDKNEKLYNWFVKGGFLKEDDKRK